MDGAVPFSVERVALEEDLVDLLVGDLDSFGVFAAIRFGTDLQAGLSGCGGNQIDDHLGDLPAVCRASSDG
jgi:hypothetical protein